MFRFIKKMCTGFLRSSGSLATKWASLNNQPFRVIPTLISVNWNEPFYYPFVVCVNKCGESCNTIYDPYAQIFKNMNVKVFNLKGKRNRIFS